MPPLVIANTIQMTWTWQNNGVDYAQNVLHIGNPFGIPVNQTLADDMDALISSASANVEGGAPSLRSVISNNVQMITVGVRDIDEANQPEWVSSAPPVFVGSDVSDPLPSAIALVTTFRTALAGRSFRGRLYMPGIGEANNSGNGNPTATAVDALQNFFREFQEQLEAVGLFLVVASRKLLTSNLVITHETDARWDTQRRRNVPGI